VNQRKIKIIVAVVAAFVVIVSLVYLVRLKTRNVVDALAINKSMINILVAGNNSFNNNRVPFYSIISINPDNGRIGVTFLPQTLKVDNGDDETIRLDQMDVRDFDKLGEYLYRSLKLKIQFYVILYGPDAARFVDMIEGVNLYVLDQIKDIEGLHTGLNYFDGKKAVRYINQSDDNSIFKKYDRIQDILFTMYYNREEYRQYLNREFIAEMMRTIKTNILPNEAYSLSKIIMKNGDLFCTVLPGKVSAEGDYFLDEVAYKIYESEFLKRLVVKKDETENIKVKVLNAAGVPGIARKVRSLLVREGVSVVEFGTYPGPILDNSIIINQKGDISSVKKVSDLTGVTSIYHIVDSTQLQSVLFIAGKDLAR
jgi:hypothetical protein